MSSDPNRFAQGLFSGLGPRYDLLGALLSFGQDRRWRREAVGRLSDGLGATRQTAQEAAPLVLDVATGTAGVALAAAAATGARVVGVDLTEGMLRRGAENLARAGAVGRVSLVAARAEQLPFPDGAFDGLAFTYLLRYVDDPGATMRELARVVRPEGPLASLDFFVPPNGFWRFWWWGYTRLVLPVAGWLTGGRHWYRVGRFLGPNISAHYRRHPLADLVRAWEAAGVANVGARVMSLGGGLVMWGRRAAETPPDA